MARRAGSWLWSIGKRRFERELREYKDPPELKLSPLGRIHKGAQAHQVFRSLLQVNFYPRDDR